MSIAQHTEILASDASSLINGLSISGKVITYTKVDGTTGTLTTQDTNTTYTAGPGLSLSSNEFSLANSGVTAGTYGLTAAATPDYGESFVVPNVVVDDTGRVTSAGSFNVTLPAEPDLSGEYLPLSGGTMTGSIHTTFDGTSIVRNNKDGVTGSELFLMPRQSSGGYNGWALLRSWRTDGSYCDLTVKPNTSELIFNGAQVRTRAGVLEQIYYGDNPSAFVMPWDGFVICGLRGAGTPAYIYLNGVHWYSFNLPDQGYGALYMPCTIYVGMGVTVSFGGGSTYHNVRIVRL